MSMRVRVSPRSDYEDGAKGFVVEQWGYWNRPDPSWAIPAWDERGHPALGGTFATREAAEAAVAEELEAFGVIEDRPVEQQRISDRERMLAWRL